VLRATTACTFFISHLVSWLRTRRFSEPTFRPFRVADHWKNTVFRTFSRAWIFSLLRLSLSCSLLLSDSSHLCLSSVHIVGSLTSKLPSTTLHYTTLITLHYTNYTYLHYTTLITLQLLQQQLLQQQQQQQQLLLYTATTTTATTTITATLHYTTIR